MDSEHNSRTGDRKGTEADERAPAVEVTPVDDGGGAMADVEPGTDVPADVSIDLATPNDDHALLSVYGFRSADGPPEVQLCSYTKPVSIKHSLTPERARRLAAELRLAATHAEEGAAVREVDDE